MDERGEPEPVCRACRGAAGDVVLDLGHQPAADHFPPAQVLPPDPVYPLRMWLCATCGLAQLTADPTVPEEARGAEPAALVAQAVDAVARVSDAGLVEPGGRVTEYGSPHGGSWLDLLAARGLTIAGDREPCDVVVDSFGMMHAADQAAALAERAARLAPGGVLLLQYHPLETIVRLGQWNSLRHGHFAYYSTSALVGMLGREGLAPRAAWQFDLYGGTVLLAATWSGEDARPDPAVESLLSAGLAAGVADHRRLGSLQRAADIQSAHLHDWLRAEKAAGRTVVGYGAASRAVVLLVRADVDRFLLEAVVDISAAKRGRRMPGTDIPIVGPDELAARRPDVVLLFLPDLLAEVRAAFGWVEASGARWVDAATLGNGRT